MNAALAAFMSAVFPPACLGEILCREELSRSPALPKNAGARGVPSERRERCAPQLPNSAFLAMVGEGGEEKQSRETRAKRGLQPSDFPFPPVGAFSRFFRLL